MAVRPVSVIDVGNGVQRAIWPDLDAADSGAPVCLAGWPTKAVQVIGGTTVDFQGSNDGGTTWAPLTNAGGTALTGVGPGIYNFRDNALLIRPNNVAGNNMVVILIAVKA